MISFPFREEKKTEFFQLYRLNTHVVVYGCSHFCNEWLGSRRQQSMNHTKNDKKKLLYFPSHSWNISSNLLDSLFEDEIVCDLNSTTLHKSKSVQFNCFLKKGKKEQKYYAKLSTEYLLHLTIR